MSYVTRPAGTRTEWRWFAAILVVIVVGKAWTVSAYAGLILGDTGSFIAAAKQILAGTEWLHDAGIERYESPATLHRPIGYSLIVAATMGISDSHWPFIVCGIQAFLSFCSGLLLFDFCRAAGFRVWVAATIMLLYQWSVPLSTDAILMEDVLMGALLMPAFIFALYPVIEGRVPSIRRLLAVGIAAAASFLIRDVYQFVMPVIGIGAAILIYRLTSMRQALLALIVLAGPVLAVDGALRSWNYYRTGVPISTLAGHTAYLYGILRAAQFDQSLLNGDDPVMQVVRDNNETYEVHDSRNINNILFNEYGMTAFEQTSYFGKRYWAAFRTHPYAMVRAALQRVRPIQQATLFAGPIQRIDDLDWWAPKPEGFYTFYDYGWRKESMKFRESLNPRDLTPHVAFHLGIRAATRIVGGIVFLIFVVGVPLAWLRREPGDGAINAAMIVWLVYGLWIALYIPISFEIRYLAPLIGLAMAATAISIVRLGSCLPGRGRRLTDYMTGVG